MTHPDDPELRVADLERQLSDVAAAAEAPPIGEPPRTGLRLGWLALAVMVAALVASAAMLAGHLTGGRPVAATPKTSEFNGGGGTFTTPSPSARSTSTPPTAAPPTSGNPPFLPPSDEPPQEFPAGQSISVAGVGRSETIACENRTASISGVDNQVVLTGRCARVDVSGVRNTVTVEESDAIIVSGMDNNVTYLAGNPELSQSGLGNTLGRS